HNQKGPCAGEFGDPFFGILQSEISNVDDLLSVGDVVKSGRRATRNKRIALAVGSPCVRCIVQRNAPERFTVVQQQAAEAGGADSRRVFQHGLEDWLEFAGRRADDLQYVGGRGLLLQRLAQLVKQPRVLNGDDGLVGEILHQRNLLLGER